MPIEESKKTSGSDLKKKKSKKTILVIVAVIVGVILFCCSSSAILGIFSGVDQDTSSDTNDEVINKEQKNEEDSSNTEGEDEDEVVENQQIEDESDEIAEPDPINIKGVGDTISDNYKLNEGYAIIDANYSGSSNFIISAIPNEGNEDLLVNEIGSYSGKTLLEVSNSQEYMFEITADGNWTIEITQPLKASKETPCSLVGSGDDVILVSMKSGNRKITLDHSGDSNFAVSINNPEAIFDFDRLVVNEIGNYSGSNLYKMGKDGVVYVEVVADGDWSIDIN